MTKSILIRVSVGDDYTDVSPQLVLEDFLSEPRSFADIALVPEESVSELDTARKILARVAEHGPPHGEKHDGLACGFCDMGGAGYASRGDGFHDDNCAVKDAQVFLDKVPAETAADLPGAKELWRLAVEDVPSETVSEHAHDFGEHGLNVRCRGCGVTQDEANRRPAEHVTTSKTHPLEYVQRFDGKPDDERVRAHIRAHSAQRMAAETVSDKCPKSASGFHDDESVGHTGRMTVVECRNCKRERHEAD